MSHALLPSLPPFLPFELVFVTLKTSKHVVGYQKGIKVE